MATSHDEAMRWLAAKYPSLGRRGTRKPRTLSTIHADGATIQPIGDPEKPTPRKPNIGTPAFHAPSKPKKKPKKNPKYGSWGGRGWYG